MLLLVTDLADDLFNHVLDGHEAHDPAILVHDHRQPLSILLKVAEQVVDPNRLGYE
jgi:hypothetical protein